MPAGRDAATTTSAEIIAATEDGMTLDLLRQPERRRRLHRHHRPARAEAAREPRLRRRADLGRRRRRQGARRRQHAKSYTAPSGRLAADRHRHASARPTCDLGGQPDSVAVSPGRHASSRSRSRTSATRRSTTAPSRSSPPARRRSSTLADGAPDCASQIGRPHRPRRGRARRIRSPNSSTSTPTTRSS